MDNAKFQKELENTYEQLASDGMERRDAKRAVAGPSGRIYCAGISPDDLTRAVMMSAASEKATREIANVMSWLGLDPDQKIDDLSDEDKLALFSNPDYLKASAAKQQATFSRLQALGQTGPKVRVFNPRTQKHELRRKPTTRASDFWMMFREGWGATMKDMFGPYQKATPEERDAFWMDWAMEIAAAQSRIATGSFYSPDDDGDAPGYISDQIDESSGQERADQALEAAQKDPEEAMLNREQAAIDKLLAEQKKAAASEEEEPTKPAKAGKAGKKATKKAAKAAKKVAKKKAS